MSPTEFRDLMIDASTRFNIKAVPREGRRACLGPDAAAAMYEFIDLELPESAQPGLPLGRFMGFDCYLSKREGIWIVPPRSATFEVTTPEEYENGLERLAMVTWDDERFAFYHSVFEIHGTEVES